MSQYILILHESPGFMKDLSPEQIQGIIQKYKAWSEKLKATGRWVGGEKLDASGRVLRGAGPKTVVKDGPYAETKEIIGGYYLIEAESYDHAIEICKDHPHLGRGTVEVREIQKV